MSDEELVREWQEAKQRFYQLYQGPYKGTMKRKMLGIAEHELDRTRTNCTMAGLSWQSYPASASGWVPGEPSMQSGFWVRKKG